MHVHVPDKKAASACEDIVGRIRDAGGQAVYVGGCVRDALLGLPIKDVDIEVYGIDADRLHALLEAKYQVDLVGKAFGVFKLRGLPIDVALPRTESKTAPGHKGFKVTPDPALPFAEAASRRDFTINAMGWDPLTETLFDPFGGQEDLRCRILRHTSEKFSEDPLRVLRGMQFVARFDLTPAPETVALCQELNADHLPPERLFEEWKKLLLHGHHISAGLNFLRETGWLKGYPELEALVDCPQDPKWHPEGDVWVHTCHCLDAFARERSGDAWEDLVVGFAVLCHDLGKPPTTQMIDGMIRSMGHPKAGEELTRSFLARLTRHKDLVEAVVPLVVTHMRPKELYHGKAGPAAIRRLAKKVGRIDLLVRVERADRQGRPPRIIKDFLAADWLLEQARLLEVENGQPEPLLHGRDLIALGLHPGPTFSSLLDQCYEAQLDGAFETLQDAQAYLSALLKKTVPD